jgi:hypothetical protein
MTARAVMRFAITAAAISDAVEGIADTVSRPIR